MIRVGVVGATGYTALECLELLVNHPTAQVTAATSRRGQGEPIDQIHPQLFKRLSVRLENLSVEEIAESCEVALCCLPHGASADYITRLLAQGCRVVDLSADYRLSSPDLYHRWYNVVHPDPVRLGITPYGLPELFSDDVSNVDLIANPGCYPTSAILPLAPVLKEGLVDPSSIIVDSKSGVSGAGRTPKENNLYGECNESFSAYAVGTHRHQPEIEDILHRYCGVQTNIVFTPHLVPMHRGILSTIYVRPNGSVSANQIRDCLSLYYENSTFVRVSAHLPATRFVAKTNYCDISVRANGDYVVILSAIDNLVKGASGAAIQNLNRMFGIAESTGLPQ